MGRLCHWRLLIYPACCCLPQNPQLFSPLQRGRRLLIYGSLAREGRAIGPPSPAMSHRGAGLTRLLLQLQPQLPGGWGTPPLALPASSPSPAAARDRAAAWAAAAAGAAAGRAPPLQQQQRRGYAVAEGGGALQKTEPPPEARQEQQQPRGAESEWTEVVDQQTGEGERQPCTNCSSLLGRLGSRPAAHARPLSPGPPAGTHARAAPPRRPTAPGSAANPPSPARRTRPLPAARPNPRRPDLLLERVHRGDDRARRAPPAHPLPGLLLRRRRGRALPGGLARAAWVGQDIRILRHWGARRVHGRLGDAVPALTSGGAPEGAAPGPHRPRRRGARGAPGTPPARHCLRLCCCPELHFWFLSQGSSPPPTVIAAGKKVDAARAQHTI